MPLSVQITKATVKFAMPNLVIRVNYRLIVLHVDINSAYNVGVNICYRGLMMGMFNAFLLDVLSILAIY